MSDTDAQMLPVQETFGHMQKSASQFMLYVDKVQESQLHLDSWGGSRL